MATSAACFDAFEEDIAYYLAQAGTRTELGSNGPPGMLVNPTSPNAFLGVTNADPRSSIVYPNSFATGTGRHATLEPTAAEWDTYARVAVARTAAQWEVFQDSGDWKFRNVNVVSFPSPGASSAGGTFPYATFCLPKAIDGSLHYLLLVAELDTELVIAAGGGHPVRIEAEGLVFTVK